MSEHAQRIRDAIQAVMDEIDEPADRWHVTQFVVAMGIERMTADGTIEASCWCWAPPEQPDWQNDGLLNAALDMRGSSEDCD